MYLTCLSTTFTIWTMGSAPHPEGMPTPAALRTPALLRTLLRVTLRTTENRLARAESPICTRCRSACSMSSAVASG